MSQEDGSEPVPESIEEWADLLVELIEENGGEASYTDIRRIYKSRKVGSGRITVDLNRALPGTHTRLPDVARQALEDGLLEDDGSSSRILRLPGIASSAGSEDNLSSPSSSRRIEE